jgi:hypothetical protein
VDSLALWVCANGGWGGARGEVNVSDDGGAGLPAERAGGTGTSEGDLAESNGLLIPNPELSCGAARVDEVRSGWVTVGVVGESAYLSAICPDPEGLNVEGLRESPRAGRSTT